FKGHQGAWTRSVVDDQGRSTWTSDAGPAWRGEFSVDSDGDLHFVPREGQAWIFTRDGRDVKDDSPQTKEYPDGSRVETVRGKVTLAEVAAEKGGELEFNRREFKYNEKDELTEVTSTFTGRTWTRREVNGQEEWVSKKEGEQEKVGKGTFSVGEDGALTYTPREGKMAFVFTRDGKTERVPAKAVEKAATPTDAKAGASGGEKLEEKPGERSFEHDGE